MSWTLFRTLRCRPIVRLVTTSPRIDFVHRTSTTNVGSNFPSNLRISKLFERKHPLTDGDWCEIRENLLKSPTVKASNIDQLIVDFCAFDNAVSYMEFLKANDMPVTRRLQLKLIQLYAKAETIPEESHDKFVELCISVMDDPSRMKLSMATQLFIDLSSTSQWRHCITLLDAYDLKCGANTLETFSMLAANAFWEDEPIVGWKLLHKIVDTGYAPRCVAFTAYWHHCSAQEDDKLIERVEEMLGFIGIHDVVVSRDVMDGLQSTVGIQLDRAKIDFHGKCLSCQQSLDNVRLSLIEFQKLKKEFQETILSKENISAHSSLSELIRFKQNVTEKRRFNVIIDGLNVAHTTLNNTLAQAKWCVNIVEHFVKQKKRVLVVGRKYMDTWPQQQLNYIRKNAHVFLTSAKSDDDVYLLYAALVSGDRTDFVSGDQMRNYSQQLSPAGRMLFRQWQKQHQIHLIVDDEDEQSFKLLQPHRYKHFCHKNEHNQWHVPYVNKPIVKLGKYTDAHVKWACFTFEKRKSTDQLPIE